MPMLLLFLSIAWAAPAPAQLWSGLTATSGWREVSRSTVPEVGEIVVRLKEISGQPCLEGVATADSPADVLLAASADVANQPRWSTWKLPWAVRLGDDPERFAYAQVLDNPYPIADRAWFLQGEVRREGSDRVFRWNSTPPEAHPQALAELRLRFPDAVLTGVNLGDWTFTPLPDGHTRVRYRICTDAGGSIPRWAGEYAATRTLPTNVADIVREGRRRIRR